MSELPYGEILDRHFVGGRVLGNLAQKRHKEAQHVQVRQPAERKTAGTAVRARRGHRPSAAARNPKHRVVTQSGANTARAWGQQTADRAEIRCRAGGWSRMASTALVRQQPHQLAALLDHTLVSIIVAGATAANRNPAVVLRVGQHRVL